MFEDTLSCTFGALGRGRRLPSFVTGLSWPGSGRAPYPSLWITDAVAEGAEGLLPLRTSAHWGDPRPVFARIRGQSSASSAQSIWRVSTPP